MSPSELPAIAHPVRRRPRVIVPLSLACAVILVLMATIGGWIAPHDGLEQNLLQAGLGPSSDHLMGTDRLGRDILSRVVLGARPALTGPLVLAVSAIVLAVTFGLLAGYRGGWIDALTMRVCDLVFAVPALLVVLVAVGLFGGGYWFAVVLLTVLGAPAGIRLVRSSVLAQRNLPYVEATRTLGASKSRLMFVHLLPNVVPTVVAVFLLDFVTGLVALSALSFLGIGAPPGTPDWGTMIAENRSLLDQQPWAAVLPALLLVTAAFSATALGDWAHARLGDGRD
ncbi:ABC transporter permease [Kribbella endophytica]